MIKVEIAYIYALNVKMYIAFEANWGRCSYDTRKRPINHTDPYISRWVLLLTGNYTARFSTHALSKLGRKARSNKND